MWRLYVIAIVFAVYTPWQPARHSCEYRDYLEEIT